MLSREEVEPKVNAVIGCFCILVRTVYRLHLEVQLFKFVITSYSIHYTKLYETTPTDPGDTNPPGSGTDQSGNGAGGQNSGTGGM